MKDIKNAIKELHSEYQTVFGISIVFALTVYLLLITQMLTNSLDGLWNNYFYPGVIWPRMIGRWFQPILTAPRYGLICHSVNSLFTICLFILGNIVILRLFNISNKVISVLFSFMVIATPLVCDSLSYMFMSPSYGAAYFFAALAAFFLVGGGKYSGYIDIVLGAIAISVSMGCYQAYLNVTCTLIVMYIIYQCLHKIGIKAIGKTTARSVVGILAGGICYYLCVQISLHRHNLILYSYQGADKIGIKNIFGSLSETIPQAYRDFYSYFFSRSILTNAYGVLKLNGVICLLLAGTLLIMVIRLFIKEHKNAVIAMICIVLLPVAAGVIRIIAAEADISILMTAGYVIMIPCLMLIIFSVAISENIHEKWYLKAALYLMVCLCSVWTWASGYSVLDDQMAMQEGRTSVLSIVNDMTSRLLDNGWLDRGNVKVVFTGEPVNTPYFKVSPVYENANTYAKFGTDWGGASSWKGMTEVYCGIDLNYGSSEETDNVIHSKEYSEMPSYPSKKCIQKIGGVVVVKISE